MTKNKGLFWQIANKAAAAVSNTVRIVGPTSFVFYTDNESRRQQLVELMELLDFDCEVHPPSFAFYVDDDETKRKIEAFIEREGLSDCVHIEQGTRVDFSDDP